MKITFTRNAILDIKNQCEYIKSKRNSDYSRSFRKKIFDRIEYLKKFPRMGPIAREYENLPSEIRYILEGNFKIIYQITDTRIFILKIISTIKET